MKNDGSVDIITYIKGRTIIIDEIKNGSVSNTIIDTKNEEITKALVNLGWTPPK